MVPNEAQGTQNEVSNDTVPTQEEEETNHEIAVETDEDPEDSTATPRASAAASTHMDEASLHTALSRDMGLTREMNNALKDQFGRWSRDQALRTANRHGALTDSITQDVSAQKSAEISAQVGAEIAAQISDGIKSMEASMNRTLDA